jgi:hypothetical protein
MHDGERGRAGSHPPPARRLRRRARAVSSRCAAAARYLRELSRVLRVDNPGSLASILQTNGLQRPDTQGHGADDPRVKALLKSRARHLTTPRRTGRDHGLVTRNEHTVDSGATADHSPGRTSRRRKPVPASLSALIPSFERSLRARNRSPKTIRGYVDAAQRLVRFLAERGCRRPSPRSPGNTSWRSSRTSWPAGPRPLLRPATVTMVDRCSCPSSTGPR